MIGTLRILVRWLPGVFVNTLTTGHELQRETLLISLKVFPVEIYQYGYRYNKAFFLGVNFWIMAVTMATSHLMTGRHILVFDQNSLLFILRRNFFILCHKLYGNDVA